MIERLFLFLIKNKRISNLEEWSFYSDIVLIDYI